MPNPQMSHDRPAWCGMAIFPHRSGYVLSVACDCHAVNGTVKPLYFTAPCGLGSVVE